MSGVFNFASNIFSEFLASIILAAYFLLTNKAELLKKLGWTRTQIDIPYDDHKNLVMLLKTKDPLAGITYLLPQTSKTTSEWETDSMVNAQELGLGRNIYNPKKSLGFSTYSKVSQKSYEFCYVKIYKDVIDLACKNKSIPWKISKNRKRYNLQSVEYTQAVLVPPTKALKLLKQSVARGTKLNLKKADVYEDGFKKLKQLYEDRPQFPKTIRKLI